MALSRPLLTELDGRTIRVYADRELIKTDADIEHYADGLEDALDAGMEATKNRIQERFPELVVEYES